MCVCVCVCVRERERERECVCVRERVCMCLRAWVAAGTVAISRKQAPRFSLCMPPRRRRRARGRRWTFILY